MSDEAQERWIEIEDNEMSAAALEAHVASRLAARRAELGPVTRRFPSFQTGAQGQAGDNATGDGALQTVLRQLASPPPTHKALGPSPATRVPLLGRLWRLVRSQAHELVLFYVNRHLAHQTRINHLLVRALQEMGADVARQQARMEALEARLEALEAGVDEPDG